jgi:hypothetical protein
MGQIKFENSLTSRLALLFSMQKKHMKTIVRLSALSCCLATVPLAAEEDNPLIERLNELAEMPLDELKANIHEVMPIIKALNGGTSEGNVGSEGYGEAVAQAPEAQAAITNFNMSVTAKLQAPQPVAKKPLAKKATPVQKKGDRK